MTGHPDFRLIAPVHFPIHPFMPQSLSNILVHLVFSTKDRTPWIADDWRDDPHG
jgi:nicotinamide riboside kinase